MSVGKMNPDEDELMIRYLLGELPDPERLALEERYFDDDLLFQQLLAAEDELADAYVRGELPENRRQAFEARLLASAEQRQKVELARELLRHAGEGPGSILTVARTSRSLRWQWAAAAAVLLAVAGGLWWNWVARVHMQPERTQTQQSPTTGPQQERAVPRPQSNPETSVVAFLLMPGAVRSSSEANAVRISSAASVVRLQLEPEGEGYQRYRAVVETAEGREVWRQAEVKPIRPGGSSVAVTLPASLLPPGDYVLTLSGAGAGGYEAIADFTFRVKR